MKQVSQKLKIVTNFIESILYKQKLIIFVGKIGIKMSAYNKHELVDSIFIDNQDPKLLTAYQTFLRNHKNFQMLFCLDSKECQLKHEFMPMLHSVIKYDPIQKFIVEHYKPEDIVAYNIYNIDISDGEVWETVIASSPYNENTNQLIEFVLCNSFKFGGIYFLSLEFESIINAILKKQNLTNYENNLQIFITITEASGIRIATKYQQNILDECFLAFPSDKSDLYILGSIEQAISDIILKQQWYVKSLGLKICLIFLCDKVLHDLLTESPLLNAYNIITYNDEFLLTKENVNQHFEDDALLELFMENRNYLGQNKLLESIGKLTRINSLVFKPLFIIMVGIIIALCSFKYKSSLIQKETIKLNAKYYALSEKYRNMKKQHPEIKNISNLAVLYHLETTLDVVSTTPMDSFQKIFSVTYPDIEITNLNWYAKDSKVLGEQILLTFDILYSDKKKNLPLAEKDLNNYVNDIKKVFHKHNVTYVKDSNNITELSKKLIISAKITISSKRGF